MSWWQYLILANIYLVLFYLFYAVMLRKETFFQLNRIYLLSSAVLSFVIPVIQADWVKNLFITQRVQYTIYSSPVIIRSVGPAVTATGLSTGKLLVIIYLAGIALLTVKLVWQTALLRRMLRQLKPTDAYSFFRKIQIGAVYANNEAIVMHESAHASQLHTADIMLAELLMIVNWFNPVVYYYRSVISEIHEYIADSCAIGAGSGTREYAVMLLNQALNVPAHKLVNPFFNKSSLKQRIIMLQKNKSNRIALAKYGFSAPLFMLMLILSSATVNNSKAVKLINLKLENLVKAPPSQISNIVKDKNTRNLQATFTTLDNGDTTHRNGTIYSSVDKAPTFPGGLNAFYKFLAVNVKYPALLKQRKKQGKVILAFVIEEDGSLSDIKAVKSFAPLASDESIRVLNLSPKWNPGYQKGKPVRVLYTVPISYALEDVSPANRTGALRSQPFNNTIASTTTRKDTIIKSDLILQEEKAPPLYVIDGVIALDITGVEPADIESISVLKGDNIPLQYKEKGRNGVVMIKTKKVIAKPAMKGLNPSGYINNSRTTGIRS